MLRDELQGGETDLADRVSERLDETRPRRPPSKFIERGGGAGLTLILTLT